MKTYIYHAQHQAEAFARSILPVPGDYPLKPGLPENFRESFARLCALAKAIYLDMAEHPEAYGLMLLDIAESDHNLARDSYRTIHRFVDTLHALCRSGEVNGSCLTMEAAVFKTMVKKNPVIPKYGIILSKLCDFGFQITGLKGSALDRKAEVLSVEYPDDPELIHTLKLYSDCWDELDQYRKHDKKKPNNELIQLLPQEFAHHFYGFDYKITADLSKLSKLTWVNDLADYEGYSPELKAFNEALYLGSLRYKDLGYNGEYQYKGKRVARITDAGYAALGDSKPTLILKLKNMDKYREVLEAMPEAVKAPMTKSNCRHCDFQGATDEYCKFRLIWTLDEIKHEGCSFECFYYSDFGLDLVPHYLKLLELEYGLKIR